MITDRQILSKIYGIFALAATKANRTEAHRIHHGIQYKRESFLDVFAQASIFATRGLGHDSEKRLTQDELGELIARLGACSDYTKTGDQREFTAACQFAAVQGWVSVDRDRD